MGEGFLLLPGCSDSASFGRFAFEAEREGTSIFTNQHDARREGIRAWSRTIPGRVFSIHPRGKLLLVD